MLIELTQDEIQHIINCLKQNHSVFVSNQINELPSTAANFYIQVREKGLKALINKLEIPASIVDGEIINA